MKKDEQNGERREHVIRGEISKKKIPRRNEKKWIIKNIRYKNRKPRQAKSSGVYFIFYPHGTEGPYDPWSILTVTEGPSDPWSILTVTLGF